MKIKRWIIFLLLLLFALPSFADVGGYVDYDYPSGGNYDYFDDYDYNYDSWSTGGNYRYGGYGFDPFGGGFMLGRGLGISPVILIVIFIVVRMIMASNRSRSRQQRRFPQNQGPVVMKRQGQTRPQEQTVQKRPETLNALREADPNFSQTTFLARVANMFVQLQQAWMDKDWKRARPFEHDQIFHLHAQQLQQFIDKGETNRIEDIVVLNTDIESYEVDGPYEYLNTIIEARFRDYVVDDESGDVIRGDKDTPVTMTYRWKLMRKRGTQSKDTDIHVTQCPNCGASLSIGQNGVCSYCGSEVTTGNHDWVLAGIERIRQTR